EDQRERIIEIVGDARDHRAQSPKAFPLNELILCGPKLLQSRLERGGTLVDTLLENVVFPSELQVQLPCSQEVLNTEEALGSIERLDEKVGRACSERALLCGFGGVRCQNHHGQKLTACEFLAHL